jgi:hypothetical protein
MYTVGHYTSSTQRRLIERYTISPAMEAAAAADRRKVKFHSRRHTLHDTTSAWCGNVSPSILAGRDSM